MKIQKVEHNIDLAVRRYKFEDDISEHVMGIWKKSILKKDIGYQDIRKFICWLNINYNADIGIFGQSSPWCSTIEEAIYQATVDFIYKFCNAHGNRPMAICYRRRE